MSLCSRLSRPLHIICSTFAVPDCFCWECSNSCPCANILHGLIRPGAHLYSNFFGISGQLSYSFVDVVQFDPTVPLPVLFYYDEPEIFLHSWFILNCQISIGLKQTMVWWVQRSVVARRRIVLFSDSHNPGVLHDHDDVDRSLRRGPISSMRAHILDHSLLFGRYNSLRRPF